MTLSATEDDLRNLQEFAPGRIRDDRTDCELKDLLDEWRAQNPDPEQQRHDLLAIQDSMTQ